MFVLKVYLSINEMRWTESDKNRKTDNTVKVRELLSILYATDVIRAGWRLQRAIEGSNHKPSHRQQPKLCTYTVTPYWQSLNNE